MKKPILFIMAICTLALMGCSTDAIEGINDQNLDSRSVTKKDVIEFKVEGNGSYFNVAPQECESKAQLDNKGTVNLGEDLGYFSSGFNICTDLESTTNYKGSYVNNAGDALVFYSNESGTDASGKWTQLIIYGGEGQFKGVTGEVKLYRAERPSGSNGGSYSESGKGVLNFN